MKVQVFALFSEAEIKSGYDSHHEEVVGKRYVSCYQQRTEPERKAAVMRG